MSMAAMDGGDEEKIRLALTLYGESSADFIEDLVRIVDKENPEDREPLFRLWPKQREALKAFHGARRVIALKARQLGVTWLILADTVWHMLFEPGYDAFALSQTEDPDAYQLVSRVVFILERLPEWLVTPGRAKGRGRTWEATASKVMVHHPETRSPSGRRIPRKDSVFQSFAATERSARGWTGDRLICDEMAKYRDAAKVWKAAQPSVNRPTSGQVILVSTNEAGSLFEAIYRGAMAGANDFHRVFLGWDADPRRDQNWYERTKRDLPDADDIHSEYPSSEEEAFARPSGGFFPELRHETHLKPKRTDVPGHWQRYAALDYGLDGFAVLWFLVDNEGMSRCYRELYTKDKTISEAAALFLSANGGDTLEQIFAPVDLWSRRQETLKSFAETFAERGVYLSQANNRREKGWEAVKELLKPFDARDAQTGEPGTSAKLTMDTGACPNLWRCLLSVRRSPRNYNDIADRTPQEHELTHLCVSGDTLIDTVAGPVKIRDLVGKTGMVHCYDETERRRTAARFHDVRMTRRNAEVFAVELDDGTVIKATAEHRVWTGEGWKRVKELKVGDEIPKTSPLSSEDDIPLSHRASRNAAGPAGAP